MKRLLLVLALLQASSAGAQAQSAPPVAMCQPNQLSLGTDTENGNFDGMSHSGTLLVLRNISPSPCRLQPLAQISVADSSHKAIPITVDQQTPLAGPIVNGKRIPMGHGPVIVPITLAPAAEATLTLRWVSGNVYDHGICLTPASIRITLGGSTLETPFSGSICGPDAAHVAISATHFALDPTP